MLLLPHKVRTAKPLWTSTRHTHGLVFTCTWPASHLPSINQGLERRSRGLPTPSSDVTEHGTQTQRSLCSCPPRCPCSRLPDAPLSTCSSKWSWWVRDLHTVKAMMAPQITSSEICTVGYMLGGFHTCTLISTVRSKHCRARTQNPDLFVLLSG